MEIIDSQSSVKTVYGTAAVDICPSLLSFQEYYYKDCYLNTPPDNNTQVQGVSCQIRYKKTMPFCFKKCKNNSEKRFKEHLSSDFLCKNFMGLGQISWPQHQFEVK